MKKIKYYFNTHTLRFEKLDMPLRVRLLKLFGFIFASIVTAIIIVILIFQYIDSPKEKLLRQQNDAYKANFSGVTIDSDMEYLELLLASKFALIPPGFYNNFNHRYTESLITGSLPAILANNSLDPSINTNWTNHLAPARRYSIKFQLRFLSKLNNIQYEHYRNLARSADFRAILDSRKLFDDVMG